MTKFTILFRLIWLVVLLSILFIDRQNSLMKWIIITLLIVLTIIAIIRALESRNQWREMIDDGDIEVKDKISFD